MSVHIKGGVDGVNDADSATSLLSEMRLTGDGKFGVP
jgi:hypothetical protein